jgi:hypothetical protein
MLHFTAVSILWVILTGKIHNITCVDGTKNYTWQEFEDFDGLH